MVPVIILQINHLSTEEKKISNAFINMQIHVILKWY